VPVRLRIRGERFRGKTDFNKRVGAGVDVCVKDAVEDGPVVDGITGGVFGIGVSGTPFQGWDPVSGGE
jgi:hypothetical protein